MKTIFKTAAASVLCAFTFAGCTYTLQPHEPKLEHTGFLKGKLVADHGNSVIEQKFKNSVGCSFDSSIATPNQESFKDYIENAFVKELDANGLFSENEYTNKFRIRSFDMKHDWHFGFGFWQFELTLLSSNGRQFDVISRYDFESHPESKKACVQLYDNFPPAVDKLMKDIFEHEDFEKLF